MEHIFPFGNGSLQRRLAGLGFFGTADLILQGLQLRAKLGFTNGSQVVDAFKGHIAQNGSIGTHGLLGLLGGGTEGSALLGGSLHLSQRLVGIGLGALHLCLGGSIGGKAGGGGMVGGAANGAGRTGGQPGCQHTGLLIHKGIVFILPQPGGFVGLLPQKQIALPRVCQLFLLGVQQRAFGNEALQIATLPLQLGLLRLQKGLLPGGGLHSGTLLLQGDQLLLRRFPVSFGFLKAFPGGGKVGFRLLQLGLQCLQPVVGREGQIDGGDIAGKLLLPGNGGQRLLQGLLRQGGLLCCRSLRLGGLLQRPQVGLCLLGQSQGGGGLLQGLLQFKQSLGQRCQGGGVFLGELIQKLQHGLCRQLAVYSVLQLGQVGGGFGGHDAPNVLQQALLGTGVAAQSFVIMEFQLILQGFIQPGVENIPENGLPFGGAGLEQTAEIALGDHGHLGKLAAAQTDDLADGGFHILLAGDGLPIRQCQLYPGRLAGGAGAAGFGAGVFGVAVDGVGFAVVGEHQLHKGGGLGIGIFGAQHVCLADAAAGFTVKGKGDGIENGGLAGTGVAGDQIQAAGAQLVQLQNLGVGIGAEGADGKLYRSHGCSSRIFSMRSATKLRCTSLMGWPLKRA